MTNDIISRIEAEIQETYINFAFEYDSEEIRHKFVNSLTNIIKKYDDNGYVKVFKDIIDCKSLIIQYSCFDKINNLQC